MDEKIVDLKIGDMLHQNRYPENICTVVYIDSTAIITKNTHNGALIHKGESLGPLKEGDLYYYLTLETYRRKFKYYYKKIPDTKLARKLYKNRIYKEVDNGTGRKLLWIK